MPEIFRVTIAREYYGPDATTGYLMVNGEAIAYSLELPWKNNQENVSCIPPGTYNGFIRYDHSDGWRIELLNVPGGRTFVQIHVGNTPSNSLGCMLVGTQLTPNLGAIAGGTSQPAYKKLKQAFYGTDAPTACPNKSVVVEILNSPPR